MRYILYKNKILIIVILLILLLFSSLLLLIPNNNNEPKEIIEEPSRVSICQEHSSVLTEDGRMFIWGSNDHGQLGNGEGGSTNDLENTPIEITDQFIDKNGNQANLVNAQISLGWNHSSLLTEDGILFMWGANNLGQLGDTTDDDPINDKHIPTDITNFFIDKNKELIDLKGSSVSLNGHSSALLTVDGRLFTWGDNFHGQLGNGNQIPVHNPKEITHQFNDDGELIDLTQSKIFIDRMHTSLLTQDGRLFMWGYNEFGQLGDGTKKQRLKPTEITHQFVNDKDEQIDLSQAKISIGLYHSSLLTKDGKLFMWGNNDRGQLGNDMENGWEETTPIEVNQYFEEDGINLSNSRISLGREHSSLLTEDGRIFTWGRNGFGQLGDETIIDKTTPTEITYQFVDDEQLIDLTNAHIWMGEEHSSLLTNDERLFTWGANRYGQIGNGEDGSLLKELSPIEILFV